MLRKKGGIMVVLSSPSGAGKTSLVKAICELLTFVRPSISFTTRKIRDSEIDGRDYFFINKNKFEEKIKNNDFLEYQNVYGNLYGSTLESLDLCLKGNNDVILEIDYKGMMTVKRSIPEAIAIYILPPDIDTLKERLQKRGEDEEKTIMLRVASSEQELQYAKYADYTLINDNYEQALDSLLAIILFNKVEKKYINKWTQQILNLNKHVV